MRLLRAMRTNPAVVLGMLMMMGRVFAADGASAVAGVEARYVTFGRAQTPFDAAMADSGQAVVVGSAGLIAVLNRNGTDIERRIPVDSSRDFLSIARGSDGLLRIADGTGSIWRVNKELDRAVVDEETDGGALLSLRYLSDGGAVAVGEFGTILVKPSGMSQWQHLNIEWSSVVPDLIAQVGDIDPHVYDVCEQVGGGFFAVGEYGLVVRYRAAQVGVERVAHDAGNLFSCASDSRGREMAAGAGGRLFVFDASKGQWLAAESDDTSDIYDIARVRDEYYAVGQGGAILESPDGQHWKSLRIMPEDETGWLIRVFPTNRNLLLFGRDGYIKLVKKGRSGDSNQASHANRKATLK